LSVDRPELPNFREQMNQHVVEIIADTHVHAYPSHDGIRLFMGACRRLMKHANSSSAMAVLCLTETAKDDYFSRLRAQTQGLAPAINVVHSAEAEAVRLSWSGGAVWVVAGRQVVARERVEILALACLEKIPDGLAADEVIRRVREAGGVPVLAWAPGKWMFKRAAIVRRLLETFGPEELLLGDSSLRPIGWPEPLAMKSRKTLAGSDPLPFAGEEEQAGRYGTRMHIDFDEARPVSSLRAALLNPHLPAERVGSRNTPWSMAHRMSKHRQCKRDAR
jgi:hypothetical protein